MMDYVMVFGTIIGVIVGWFLHDETERAYPKALFNYKSASFNVSHVVTLTVGILLLLFGGKLHRLFRFIGLGILAREVGYTIYGFARAVEPPEK